MSEIRWTSRGAHLSSSEEYSAIDAPRERERVTSNVELRGSILAPCVPEADCAVGSTACKLKLPYWVEEHLFDCKGMALQFRLGSRARPFWIPDPDRPI